MTKTNELKKLIKSIISEVINTCGFKKVPKDTMYPHATFSFSSVNLGDMNRNDYIIDVDLWDKGESTKRIDEIADNLEEVFNNKNIPQDSILPTFYLMDRRNVEDEDKDIQHVLLRIEVQNYER